MTVPPGSAHLSEEILAAWVDGGLSRDDRAKAAAHLVDCDECRSLALESGGLLRGYARPHWMRRMAIGGLAAAAAVALLILTPETVRTPVGTPPTRTGGPSPAGEDVLRFAAVGPPTRSIVRPDTIILRWESLTAGTTYRVTLSNDRGDILLRTETRDTALSLQEIAATLIPGDTYNWVVDARLPNLRSAHTARASFQVAIP
ncbi:MAG TPA: zf-HC2 domain-containing protein [Gemmatimonadales bacterium]|nr:zf-HC2 domain-containing protein [Gemmatimonadales bacterium]